MKCPDCNTKIPWYRGAWGIDCPGCSRRLRNETARLLVWSLLVDALVVAVFLLGTGFWLGTAIVLAGGIALFFLMGCKLEHPLVDRMLDS